MQHSQRNTIAIKRSTKVYAIALLFTGILIGFTNRVMAQATGLKANNLFGRKYKIGETCRYKLTMEEFHNGKWDHTNIAVCELKVVKDSSGIPYDEVHWISRKTVTVKDTIEANASARAVKPYLISLHPKGRIDIPKIDVADMTEPIQDFNTFFVAVSPLVGTGRLLKKGDTTATADPVIADFSNGSTILKGQDCISFSVKLTNITKSQAMLYTPFFPPNKSCLSFITPDMNTPVVADTVNNFQMVMQTGTDQYLVQYGREMFHINSTIRKLDGKISTATMYNKLNLKMKINCNKEYKNCQFEMPFAEERNLKLELL